MQNIAIVCALALGGIITNDGTERGYWNSTVVVYCDIVKVDIVQKATEINGHAALSQTTTVVINPIATLAGTIDPSSSPTIRAYAEFGIGLSDPPTEGSKAVVVIQRYENQYSIPNGGVCYMPNKIAITEVKNFEDPKVAAIIENLRELHAS